MRSIKVTCQQLEKQASRYNRSPSVAQRFRKPIGVRLREFQVSGLGESSPWEPSRIAQGADDAQGGARSWRIEVIISTAPWADS